MIGCLCECYYQEEVKDEPPYLEESGCLFHSDFDESEQVFWTPSEKADQKVKEPAEVEMLVVRVTKHVLVREILGLTEGLHVFHLE